MVVVKIDYVASKRRATNAKKRALPLRCSFFFRIFSLRQKRAWS